MKKSMNLSRMMAFICSIAMLVTLLAGCGQSKKTEDTPPPASTSDAQTQTPPAAEDGNTVTLADGTVYPSEPITILCGWAPGGNSDLMCQLLASELSKSIGVDTNVSYMEGGDGTIALADIAHNTEADGYTIALCAGGQFSLKPFTQDVSYVIEDFEFLPGACEECYCIYVNKNTGFETLDDLVAYYKENPDKTLRYGMSGANGIPHLSTKMVWDELGLENTQVVSYDGGSAALAGCLGGEVEAIVVVASIGQPSYEAGDLNAIVMLTAERLAAMPDVKTLGEYGYETISAGVKKAFLCPAGTDPEIVAFLSEKCAEIFATDTWAEFLAANACNPCKLSGEEYRTDCMDNSIVYWDLLESMGLLKAGAAKFDYMK